MLEISLEVPFGHLWDWCEGGFNPYYAGDQFRRPFEFDVLPPTFVSILIMLEISLEVRCMDIACYPATVSILIMLEISLEDHGQQAVRTTAHSFNPYYAGDQFRSCNLIMKRKGLFSSFNPYYAGDQFRSIIVCAF